MKALMLFFGVVAMNTGFSQIKTAGDNTFDLVVRISYFGANNNSGCEMLGYPITLIGKVQNVLDKTSLGDEVELIFARPWMLNRLSKADVYKLKVQFFKPVIDFKIKNQVGNDTINSTKTKLLVISSQPGASV